MIYSTKKEMIESIQQHIAEGGQVEFGSDFIEICIGFKSKSDPSLNWMMPMASIKERKFDELASPKLREAQARALNHQHAYILNDLNCKLCLVHKVLTD